MSVNIINVRRFKVCKFAYKFAHKNSAQDERARENVSFLAVVIKPLFYSWFSINGGLRFAHLTEVTRQRTLRRHHARKHVTSWPRNNATLPYVHMRRVHLHPHESHSARTPTCLQLHNWIDSFEPCSTIGRLRLTRLSLLFHVRPRCVTRLAVHDDDNVIPNSSDSLWQLFWN